MGWYWNHKESANFFLFFFLFSKCKITFKPRLYVVGLPECQPTYLTRAGP